MEESLFKNKGQRHLYGIIPIQLIPSRSSLLTKLSPSCLSFLSSLPNTGKEQILFLPLPHSPSETTDTPFSYVLVAATSTFFINTLHVVLTSKARKRSGLKYPVPYASNELAEKDAEAYKFNCGKLCFRYLEALTITNLVCD